MAGHFGVFKFPAHQRAIISALQSGRKQAGLSQRALCKKLREPPYYVHVIEALKRDISVAEFIAFAEALDIPADELIRRAVSLALGARFSDPS